ncbi:MAG: prolipoprotein diacylglyceryl transferase [Pseudomonadota bacterium]
MIAAIPFPDISPDIFSVSLGEFTFALRWYAMAYITGIVGAWLMARWAAGRAAFWPGRGPLATGQQIEDLMTWVVIGIIAGGRLGYVLFYQPAYYAQNPVEILFIWQGGMAFHGGALLTGLLLIVYARRHAIRVPSLLDLAALCAPLGLGLGRIANFINAELWGRPTDVPWGVIFPGQAAQDCGQAIDVLCARHPSQLYQATLEGLVLLILVWTLAFRGWTKVPGFVCGAFIAGYGCVRVFVEYFRQADAQYITPDNPLGHVIRLGEAGLTMGQVLSIPMILLGLAVMALALRARPKAA